MSSAQKGDDTGFVITGDQLRHWREAVGMSQHDLAKRLYYSSTVIARWENGAQPIPSEVYQQLAAIFASCCRQQGEQLEAVMRDLSALGLAFW